MRLTELELDCIRAMYRSEYHCGDDKPGIWAFSVTDNAEITNPNQVCGVISSLSKKGIVACEGDGEEAIISIISDEIHEMAQSNGWVK